MLKIGSKPGSIVIASSSHLLATAAVPCVEVSLRSHRPLAAPSRAAAWKHPLRCGQARTNLFQCQPLRMQSCGTIGHVPTLATHMYFQPALTILDRCRTGEWFKIGQAARQHRYDDHGWRMPAWRQCSNTPVPQFILESTKSAHVRRPFSSCHLHSLPKVRAFE